MPLRRNRSPRKFGFELEFSRNISSDVLYSAVRTAARNHGMTASHRETAQDWTMKSDCSCGWEITSPALTSTPENFEKVRNVIIDIKNNIPADLRERAINRSCGFHTHMEVGDLNNQQLRNMFKLFQLFEPALFNLQPRSRNGNGYCFSIRSNSLPTLNGRNLSNATYSHSAGVNFGRYNERKTIEIRYGSPSLRGRRVINWIQTLLFLVEHSRISPVLDNEQLTNTTAADLSEFIRRAETEKEWLNNRRRSLSTWINRRHGQLTELYERRNQERNRRNTPDSISRNEIEAEMEIRELESRQE